MAMKRKPRSQLSKSGKYYRDNPKAAAKKAETDKKINARPEQVKKRVESAKARRKAVAAGKSVKGKDASHTKSGRVVLKSVKANRGSKTDTAGDRRARGKRK